jgi:hypothetical protein
MEKYMENLGLETSREEATSEFGAELSGSLQVGIS